MDFELKGKTAFVTGGSRGIGRAIALTLAKQGVNIAICGRTQESLDATAADIQALGVKAWAYQTDVSKVEELEAFADKALAAASSGAPCTTMKSASRPGTRLPTRSATPSTSAAVLVTPFSASASSRPKAMPAAADSSSQVQRP